MRRLLRLAVLAWLGRWAAGEVAAYLGRHPRSPGPPPLDSPHPPGWMPGPELDHGDRWEPAELGTAVRKLISEAAVPQPVYGAV